MREELHLVAATEDEPIALVGQGEPRSAALDLALSHALLRRVAAGELGRTVRLYRPAATVALSRLDRLRSGYPAAAAEARAHGYEPVLRLVGGRAAAYNSDSLLYEEIVAAPLTYGLEERFARVGEDLREVLRELGLDARIGELVGEYCPGAHSINLAGRTKVAGVAQRAIAGAALVSAIVVVDGETRLRAVLRDVYAALEYEWDPGTVGSLAGARPGLGVADVEYALRARLSRHAAITETEVDASTIALACTLQPGHTVDARGGPPAGD